MIKSIVSSVSALALVLVAGNALAGGEMSPPETAKESAPTVTLTPEQLACLSSCTKTASDVETLMKWRQDILDAKERAKKNAGPRVDRVADLEKKLLKAIKDGDKAVTDSVATQILNLKAELQPQLDEIATLKGNLERIERKLGDLGVRVGILETKVEAQGEVIATHETRIEKLEGEKAEDIDLGVKAGVLVLRSEMFNYAALPVTVFADFPLGNDFSLLTEGGVAIAGESEDTGILFRLGLRYDIGSGFGINGGVNYVSAGPDTQFRATFVAVPVDLGLSYTNDWFTANVNGLLGPGFHHNGDNGVAGGVLGQVGVVAF